MCWCVFSQAGGELPGGSLIAGSAQHATQSRTRSSRRLDDLKATLAVLLSAKQRCVVCVSLCWSPPQHTSSWPARAAWSARHACSTFPAVKYGDLQLQKCENYARAGSASEISSKLVTAATACKLCCQQSSDTPNLSIIYQSNLLHQSAHTEVQHGDVRLTRIAAVSAQYFCRAEVQPHGAAVPLSLDKWCSSMQSQSSWRTAASRCTSWHDESHSTAGRSAFSAARQPAAGEHALTIYNVLCDLLKCHPGDRPEFSPLYLPGMQTLLVTDLQ